MLAVAVYFAIVTFSRPQGATHTHAFTLSLFLPTGLLTIGGETCESVSSNLNGIHPCHAAYTRSKFIFSLSH